MNKQGFNYHNISVFCGARNDVEQTYQDLAKECGDLFAKYGLHLIYGGGDSGLMGILARSAHQGGAKVTGIFPKSIPLVETLQQGLDYTIFVDSLSVRKDMMIARSDAFLVLPGGFGTLDEFFEVITLSALNIIDCPIILLNHQNYWRSLLALCEDIAAAGFAKKLDSLTVVNSLPEAFKCLGYT